jgi:hypothetical protein
MRVVPAVCLLLALASPALVAAVHPQQVLDAAHAVAALRRQQDGLTSSDALPRTRDAHIEEAIRGLAHEAPSHLDEIKVHYKEDVMPALALNADDASPSWVDRLFGPITVRPEQTHLGFGEYFTSNGTVHANVTITWITSEEATSGQVCFECASHAGSDCITATTFTYHPISVIPWFGNVHRAQLSGPHLLPGQTCTYRIGSEVNASYSVWSNTTTFTVPTLAGDTVFAAVGGDMGTIQLVGYKMASQMLAYDQETRPFDVFWHLGDIAYSTLDPPKLNFEFFWDMYLRQEEPLLNHVPVTATFGNHDFSGGDSAAFINRFANPSQYGGNGNFYFAYRHGPVLFVSMCTEVALNPSECSYTVGSKQYQWLEATFAGINRTETPWLVLAGHRPMYSSDKSTDSGPLQELIEPLIVKYKVDLELAGHMHCTELTAPVANDVVNMTGVTKLSNTSFVYDKPSAPVHVTAGTLGAIIVERYVEPQPAWSMVRAGTLFSDSYGFVTLNATRTSLGMTFHRQADGSTTWEVLITK